jgi:ADP-ribose pyrophosphatase YjhB (NUDIX family)
MAGAYDRRRGTAIIEDQRGILVVTHGEDGIYLLPGGGARQDELQIIAAIRELREETGLYPIEVKYLFTHLKAKVFAMKVKGTPKPCNEIRKIEWYQPGSRVNVSGNTRAIINRYLMMKE